VQSFSDHCFSNASSQESAKGKNNKLGFYVSSKIHAFV
jgi:hypothetical protein